MASLPSSMSRIDDSTMPSTMLLRAAELGKLRLSTLSLAPSDFLPDRKFSNFCDVPLRSLALTVKSVSKTLERSISPTSASARSTSMAGASCRHPS